MKSSQTAMIALLMGLNVLVPANRVFAQDPPAKKNSASKNKGTTQATLSGCLDQQEGRYVLVDDHSLQPVADLEAEGFPVEGFAKYLGQRVNLRGTSNPGNTRQLFKVRSVETVSETCAPASQPEKK